MRSTPSNRTAAKQKGKSRADRAKYIPTAAQPYSFESFFHRAEKDVGEGCLSAFPGEGLEWLKRRLKRVLLWFWKSRRREVRGDCEEVRLENAVVVGRFIEERERDVAVLRVIWEGFQARVGSWNVAEGYSGTAENIRFAVLLDRDCLVHILLFIVEFLLLRDAFSVRGFGWK